MILIVSALANDPTVVRLGAVLRERGADYAVIAPTTMAGRTSLAIGGDQHGGHSVLQLEGRQIDLAGVRAAWLWRSWARDPYEPDVAPIANNPEQWSFFNDEWRAFCKGFTLWLGYSGVFCVNPPPFNLAFEEKCCQLMLAAQAGLRVPSTLYTASLAVARDFNAEHPDGIIYKPFKGFTKVTWEPGQPLRMRKLYTNRVKAEHLVETEHTVPTPGIFQPYVAKKVELRIVVIGRNLFTCAIHSQQSERSREDWRRYDLEHTPYEPYDLPDEIARKVLAFMDRLGLIFGSIDMIVTPEEEYVFLELNPMGQFDWIAHRTGLPLYQHLAAMLCAGRADYPAPAL